MFDPSNPGIGRGMLLFAAIALGLALLQGLGRDDWQAAAFWLALAVFSVCYGAITLNVLPRLQRLLLVVGLAAGGAAFWLALQASLGV